MTSLQGTANKPWIPGFGAEATTVAYTSFLLEAAWSEEMLLAYSAVLPCQRLYDWLFSTIARTEHISDENPYKKFIMQYLACTIEAILWNCK